MSQHTVNELLEMEKRLSSRLSELGSLVSYSAQETVHRDHNGNEVITKTKYNIIDIDTKRSEIQEALYSIKAKIKESNAKTQIEMPSDFNFKNLISQIKAA